MTGAAPHGPEAKQDVHRAVVLMSLAQGITWSESAAALQYDAAVSGASVHAAALAFLAPVAAGTPPEAVPSPAARPRRHLFAVGSAPETELERDGADSTAGIRSAR